MVYDRGMKIGELANKTGLTTKTIRYYEDIGVLPEPGRQANGYRSYHPSVIDRVGFIKDAQASGLSLIEIQVILELRDEGESTCGHTVRLLESHLEDVQTQIIDLHRTRTLLEKMIVKAKALDPADCLNPNRCQTISATHLQMEGTGTE